MTITRCVPEETKKCHTVTDQHCKEVQREKCRTVQKRECRKVKVRLWTVQGEQTRLKLKEFSLERFLIKFSVSFSSPKT